MPDQNNKSGSHKVSIINVKTTLKQRLLGIFGKDDDVGFIPDDLIDLADREVSEFCVACSPIMGENIEKLSNLWAKMKDMPACAERDNMAKQIFLLSHEIKDMSALCGYDLIAYFSESLRDYIAKTELSVSAQIVIIQAHLDALMVVHHKGYKKDAGDAAEELKAMVKKAIEKYKT